MNTKTEKLSKVIALANQKGVLLKPQPQLI